MEVYVDSFLTNSINHTEAINSAIEFCSKNGGGKVIFSSKKEYRSGTIFLADNIELYFEDDAILKASDDVNDFDVFQNNKIEKLKAPTWENCEYDGTPTKYFIFGVNKKNVSITGNGIIDGNEEIFYGKSSNYHIDGYFYPRVPLIYLIGCKNIKIENVTLRKSAFWTVHLVGSKNIVIDGIKIYNNLILANSDGIDPDHCKNLVIKNCYIESADDCIVFKATKANKHFGGCKDIEVFNCTLRSTSAAIKFGTESVSDFRSIYVHDCKIINSNRGISFQLRDSGNIRNILFKNISIETKSTSPLEWWGKAEPISITAVKRNEATNIGKIKNVVFEDINCDSENGIFIYGDESFNISNIKFSNVFVSIKAKTNWPRGKHDLRPSYEYTLLETPLSVIYSKNASDIILEGFNYELDDVTKDECLEAFSFNNTINVVSR